LLRRPLCRQRLLLRLLGERLPLRLSLRAHLWTLWRLGSRRRPPIGRRLWRPLLRRSRLARLDGEGLGGRRAGLRWLRLVVAFDVLGGYHVLGGCHERHVRHRFRLETDDACVDLGIDAPEQRPHVEIEQGPVGRDHAICLGPRRQGIERALLQRLHHLRAGCELGREICFRQSARGAQIPK
jgi:hypothetical protein